jgi:ankyrin repeat protein
LNEQEQEHIRHTFLSGGAAPRAESQTAVSLAATQKNPKLTPIHNECFYNHGDNLVESLTSLLNGLSDPTEINWQDSIGLSALHLLCGFNGSAHFIKALELLLESKANYKAMDLRGYTPFHYMCFNAMIPTEVQQQGFTLLLRYGADINAKEYRVRASPLHLLCNYNTTKKLDSILSLFVLHRASLHARTIENRTALHCLCRTHHDEHLLGAITILVRHGADANVRDEKNLTALHEVCLFYQRSDLGSVIDQLLSAKATCINYGAMHKRTALHLIAIHYHGDNLPELIDSMIGRHGIISFFFYSFFIVFLLIIVAYVRYRCRSKSK